MKTFQKISSLVLVLGSIGFALFAIITLVNENLGSTDMYALLFYILLLILNVHTNATLFDTITKSSNKEDKLKEEIRIAKLEKELKELTQ